MPQPQIVWLRRDLRLADQSAFYAAAKAGPVVPVFLLDDAAPGHHAYGGASRWWLHHSLQSLDIVLARHNSRIVLRRGDVVAQLMAISEELGGAPVHAIRHYEPWWRKAQGALARQVDLHLYDGNYLLPPGAVTTGSGTAYKIYTPFSKATLDQLPPRDVLPAPEIIAAPASWPASDVLADWKLLPKHPDWAGGLQDFWQVGEAAAHRRLAEWENHLAGYDHARNLPSKDGSSRLSPHLHFGEISPVQVWHALKGSRSKGWTTFEKELIWRDYAANVICKTPDYPVKNYRDGYGADLWRDPDLDERAAADLTAWQQGRTGYPIVDAGMRQLWRTGWMHNRVRMIAASFLIKHLLIDWRHGERWFWDTLVDADYASNGVNWQWSAGTGVDSNMFVRIMAPLSQSEKFDAAAYIRTYVPELAGLDEPYIHDPDAHGCRPEAYPAKRIGHREARERALAAYQAMKRY